jgi:hypothetical protein
VKQCEYCEYCISYNEDRQLWCDKQDVQVCGNEADSCTLYLEFGESAPKPAEGTPNFAQQGQHETAADKG